jgi:stage II sporulation protein E
MAVKMLNGFLRNRGSGSLHECSSTVDLMELDLMRGRASFYKSGAAPTYVYRNGSLFKLRSRTVPVGILREPDSRKIGFDVGQGDVIVMVSDGVTQGKEECPRLFDLLRSHGEEASPDRLADLILKYAKEDGATDDLSVLVIKIA